MPTLTPSERVGTTIGGRYEVRRLIGEGGFSAVFESVHSITGREVALKLLHPHLTTTEQISERFLMEARAMARIKHDGIVQVLDAGTDPDGTVFIALELLDGESLENTLSRVHKLTWGEAVSICVDVLGALAEAHRHQIIHRDIKPGNIFIVRKADGSSEGKLLDFGIAHVAAVKTKLTAVGMILGTPEYMSPEQGRTANVGPESDLWSVGIVMWECLTGHTPFVSETATEILLKIATVDAPSILEEVPDLPPPIAAVIDKSLVRDLTQRYRSADEMRDAMQRAVRKIDEVANVSARSVLRGNTPTNRPPAASDDARRALPPPDVVKFGGGSKVQSPSATSGGTSSRTPTRVMSGESPSKARGSVSPVPLGDRPVFRPPQSGNAQRPSAAAGGASAALRAAVEVTEPRAPAEQTPRATGVMPAGSSDDDFDLDARPASQEARRPDSSPSLSRPLLADESVAKPMSRPPTPFEEAEAEARAALARIQAKAAVVESPVPAFQLRSPSPTPPPELATSGVAQRPAGLTFDDRESRTFPGRTGEFQKPPDERRTPVGLIAMGALAAGLLGTGLYLVIRGDGDAHPQADAQTPRNPDTTTHTAAPSPDATVAVEPPPGGDFSLVAINDVELPQGVTGADNAAEFARHSAASCHSGTTQRMVATCIPGADGSTLYLHAMTPGPLRGSSRGIVACAGYDLGVVPDMTADGSDDVVAVGARHNQLLLIDSRTLRPYRTIDVEGVSGIAAGAQVMVRGEPAIIVFAEPNGAGEPTEVRAITAISARVLWRIRGSGRIGRVGHPVELGLAVGPDANGDDVGDVAVGLGPVVDSSASMNSDDHRCVQLFSGADGRALWAQPFCQSRTHGSQSVSVGPDANGDGKADVVVGTDQPAQGEAPVVLLSGADGSVIRQWAAPRGEAGLGFGWPVALSGDLNGNGTPDLLVGMVGSHTGVRVFDATTGAAVTSIDLGGVGAGNLRVFPVPTLVAGAPWSVVVSSPSNGIHVYMRRDNEEPL